MDVRFTTTRFRAGYDMSEVDDFLDRCDQALDSGDGSVTAESVLAMRFTPTQFREGYDMEEVDVLLDEALAPRFAAPAPGDAAAQAMPPQALAQGQPSQPDHASSAERPVPHPAEQREGLLSRLFRNR